jgi:hypothetical protein
MVNTPAYDPNVPIITPGGGTEAAYKDPNSPESIMRKVAKTDAQSKVDTIYDVQTFVNYKKFDVTILYTVFLPLLLIALFLQKTRQAKLYIISLCVILLVISIYFTQNLRL